MISYCSEQSALHLASATSQSLLQGLDSERSTTLLGAMYRVEWLEDSQGQNDLKYCFPLVCTGCVPNENCTTDHSSMAMYDSPNSYRITSGSQGCTKWSRLLVLACIVLFTAVCSRLALSFIIIRKESAHLVLALPKENELVNKTTYTGRQLHRSIGTMT